MIRFFIFLLVFIVVNSFFVIEEESLVVLASIIWLDAAGGVIREALTSELEGRGDKIKATFYWYLNAKKNLINLLITKHSERAQLAKKITGIYDLYVEKLLNGVLISYNKHGLVLSNLERKQDIIELGLTLVNDLARKEMQLVLGYPKVWEFDSLNKGVSWLDKSVKNGLIE